MVEPGEIDEVDRCFLFFKRDRDGKFTTPLSFQYKLKLGNGEWISIRDERKFVVDAALEAFRATSDKDLRDYQRTFELSVSHPARYEKYLREGDKEKKDDRSYEFFVLGSFSERDEVILRQIAKEEVKPKVRKPPMKKVERNESIQAAMSGKLPIAIMSPTDVAAETDMQNDEVFPEISPASSIFTEEEHAEAESAPNADAPATKTAAAKKADDKPNRRKAGAKSGPEKEVQSA